MPTPNPAPPAAPPRITAAGWGLLGLLVAASVLFFIDRQTLAVLKTTLAREFSLSNRDYAILLNAYMVPYTLGYLVSGQLIDRWGTRRCAPIFLAGMALATLACGLARTFPELLAARVALGLAESGVVPCVMVLITQAYPAGRRGFIVTLHQALQSVGPVVTPPLVAALTVAQGWQMSFIVPGALSFAVAAAWLCCDRSVRPASVATPALAFAETRTRPRASRSLQRVFMTPALRGVLLVRVITDPAWFFLISWQAAFLQERGGWSLSEVGYWMWLPPAFAALGNVLTGLWSDRLLRRHGDARTARRIALQRLACLAPCLALAPLAVDNKPAVLGLLVLAYFMANCWLTMINVLVTELAPAGTVATTLGVMSAVGGGASILFNYIAGPLVDRFGYDLLFVTAACLHPLGAAILYFFQRPREGTIEPVVTRTV